MHSVLQDAADILQKKGQDYNGKRVSESNSDYFPYGDKSYITMLHIKLERIKQVSESISAGESQNFESLYDSILDLINYSAMYGAYIKEPQDALEALNAL